MVANLRLPVAIKRGCDMVLTKLRGKGAESSCGGGCGLSAVDGLVCRWFGWVSCGGSV